MAYLENLMYKTRKVFDVTDGMPEAVKVAIRTRYEIMANGVYFDHEIMSPTYIDERDDGTEIEVVNEEYSTIDEYFLQFCTPGENVLILYWW